MLRGKTVEPIKKEINVHSTNVPRTIQSAYAELSGLIGMWEGKAKIKKLHSR
jgi:hypothetical protein